MSSVSDDVGPIAIRLVVSKNTATVEARLQSPTIIARPSAPRTSSLIVNTDALSDPLKKPKTKDCQTDSSRYG